MKAQIAHTLPAETQQVHIQDIPTELRDEHRWVVAINKVPYRPCDPTRRADSTDPSTWSDFDTAWRLVENGTFPMLGFVLGNGFVGVDLDKCRDPETGIIESWATDIIELLDSYTETSVSGTGVHVICYGKLPPGGNKKGKVEMYSDGRYFVTTGHMIRSAPIEDRTAELAILHANTFGRPDAYKSQRDAPTTPSGDTDLDDAVLDRARSASNSAKFLRLWSGDTTMHNDDDSAADLALCRLLAFYTQDVGQIDRLVRRSGLYRQKWDRQDYRDRTIATALAGTRCSSPLLDGQAGDIAPATTPPPVAPVSYPTTDQGNGEYFADLYGHAAKYDYLQQRWLVWTDHYWAPDTANAVSQIATTVARQRRTDAAALNDPVAAKSAFAWAFKSESSAGLANTLKRAEAQPGCQQITWDTDPYSLGVPEGVVNTRTGAVRAGVHRDDITFQTGVPYDATATCPAWERFFGEIFNHDPDLMHYVHKAVGYSLTADTSEQVFFLCHGKGSNGKGTFTHALRHVLGDYAHTLSFSLFEAKNTAQYDLASLPGKRFVTLAEVPDAGYTLNSALIKTLTGQDTIRVANKHQRAFDCTPVAKYWMEVNHLPRMADDGHALWRRLRYIPFLQTFTPDVTLPARLENEAAGILAWAVRGAVLWHTERLTHVPPVMTQAAADYRADSDVLGDFLAACVVKDPTARCSFALLYDAYLQWSERDRSKPMSKQMFGRKLQDRYEKDPTVRERSYRGLALKASGHHDPSQAWRTQLVSTSPVTGAS